MKLHLPLSLLAAVTLACFGTGQVRAEKYDTETTTVTNEDNSTTTSTTRIFYGGGNENMLNTSIADVDSIQFALTNSGNNWLSANATVEQDVEILSSYDHTANPSIEGDTNQSFSNTGLHIRNGGSGTVWFKGSITGAGALSKSGAGTNMHLLMTGDVSQYAGNITLNADSGRTFYLEFGGQAADKSDNLKADRGYNVADVVNVSTASNGVSGTGSITFESSDNTLVYNYSTENTAYVTNEIITNSGVTSNMILCGSSNMQFTDAVTISNLTLEAGSVPTDSQGNPVITFTAQTSILNNLTIGANKTVSIAGSTLTLIGATIANSGTLDIGNGGTLQLAETDTYIDDYTVGTLTLNGQAIADGTNVSSYLIGLSNRQQAEYATGTISINTTNLSLTWNGSSEEAEWMEHGIWNITGSTTPENFTFGDSVVFDASAAVKTVNIASDAIVNTISIQDDYTFRTTSSATISGTFSMAAGKTLTKSGADSTLTLDAAGDAVSFANLKVEEGTLQISTGSGAEATIAALSSTNANGTFSGAGSGTTTISSLSGYTGSIAVDGGTLVLNDDAANLNKLTISAGKLSVAEGKSVTFNSTESKTYFTNAGITISVGANAVLEDKGYWMLAGGANSLLTIEGGGTYKIGGIGLSTENNSSAQLTIASGTTLHITGTSKNALGGKGSFSLSEWGWTNTITINGTLISDAAISNRDGKANVNIESTGRLVLNAGIECTTHSNIESKTPVINVSGTLAATSSTAEEKGYLTVNLKNGATLEGVVLEGSTDTNVTIGTDFHVDEDAALTFKSATGQSLTVSDDMSAASSLTAVGGGSVTLSHVDGFSGSVSTEDATALTLTTTTDSATATISTLSGDGNFTKAGAGSVSVTAFSNYSGDISVTGGNLILNAGNQLLANYDLAQDTTLTLHAASGTTITTTFTADNTLALSGSGTVEKTGAGVWELNGNNSGGDNSATFSGNIIVSAGELRLGQENTGGIGSAATVNAKILGEGNITIKDGATLALSFTQSGTYDIANSITLEDGGNLASRDGNYNFTGMITLTGDATIKTAYDPKGLTVNSLSGAGYTLTHTRYEDNDGVLKLSGDGITLGKLKNEHGTVRFTNDSVTVNSIEISDGVLQFNTGTYDNVGDITLTGGAVGSTDKTQAATFKNNITLQKTSTVDGQQVITDVVTFSARDAAGMTFKNAVINNNEYQNSVDLRVIKSTSGEGYLDPEVNGANMVVKNDIYTVNKMKFSNSLLQVQKGATLKFNDTNITLEDTALEVSGGGKIILSSSALAFTAAEASATSPTTLSFGADAAVVGAEWTYTAGFNNTLINDESIIGKEFATVDVSSWSNQSSLLAQDATQAALFTGVADSEAWGEYNMQRVNIFFGTGNANNGIYNLALNEAGSVFIAARVVPEPTTATLSLLALTALCARRRRRA